MSTENPYSPPETEIGAVEAEVLCPGCGQPMEKGMVQSLGNITWYPTMVSFKRSVPTRLSPKGLNLESKLPALKCETCGTVTIKVEE